VGRGRLRIRPELPCPREHRSEALANVCEVWVWVDGRIFVYVLGQSGYEERERSEWIPDIDREALVRWASEPDQHAALKGYRQELRRSGA